MKRALLLALLMPTVSWAGGSAAVPEVRGINITNSSNNYQVLLRAGAPSGANITLTLPNTAGTSGYALITDGSGNLSWSAAGGGLTVDSSTVTGGTIGNLFYHGSGNVLRELVVASANTASAVVTRDSSGNFAAGTITASLTGTASAATLAAAATALAADPSDCSGNNFALGIAASGAATCAQPAFSNLSGSATAAQLPAALANSISINGLGITSSTGTLTIANSKTLTVSNTITLSGTDGASLAIGAGGTALLSGGALGTPSSGTLTNATGLPEGGLSLTDITTNNASTSKHGFLPKLDNNSAHYLDGTGAWSAISASGDVVGPSSSVDNAIARFDGTTGKLLQGYTSGGPTISDTGLVSILQSGQTSALLLGAVAGFSAISFNNSLAGTGGDMAIYGGGGGTALILNTPSAGTYSFRVNAAESLGVSGSLVSATVPITTSGTITSSATGSIGWSVVTHANQACNTTCTSACAGAQDTDDASRPIVDCADITADRCYCAGPN